MFHEAEVSSSNSSPLFCMDMSKKKKKTPMSDIKKTQEVELKLLGVIILLKFSRAFLWVCHERERKRAIKRFWC